MSKSQPNRIPGSELRYCRSWRAPDFDDAQKIIPSAEKEARERRNAERQRRGEVVGQTVDSHGAPLTAAQLQEITEAAHQEGYAAGFQEGKTQGHKDGYRAGEAEALAACRPKLDREIARLAQLADGLSNPFERQNQQLERMVLDTVVALTRSVVKRELQQDLSTIQHLVREAMNALPAGADDITIYLNPDDMPLMDNYFAERAVQWKLSGDPGMLPGGCRVETRHSLVDFSVEERLRQITEQFLRGELMAGASDNPADDDIGDGDGDGDGNGNGEAP